MAVRFLVEETGIPGENHRPAASHSHTIRFLIKLTGLFLGDIGDRSSRDRMIGGFTITYVISGYDH
jgi:hypothetical protein